MMETFKEFTFDAAHSSPPFEGLHGHTFTVRVVLTGEPDPVYGWSHNLYDVNAIFDSVRQQIDHKYLNDIEGLSVPTLENLTRWIWTQFDSRMAGIDRVIVTRGTPGQTEGCSYSGPTDPKADRIAREPEPHAS